MQGTQALANDKRTDIKQNKAKTICNFLAGEEALDLSYQKQADLLNKHSYVTTRDKPFFK